MVDYPLSNFRHYYNEFLARGVTLAPQTFLGRMNNVLLPNADSDVAPNYDEHGISDYGLYQLGFSCEEKKDVLCASRRFLVSPSGSIHRCHYHLYSNCGNLGNARDEVLPTFSDYSICSDFGYCNPCDYPHVKFKHPEVHLVRELEKIVKDGEFAKFLVEYIQDNKDKLASIISVFVDILYCSDDPYWELYNNKDLFGAINKFVGSGDLIDNENALLFAQLDALLFGYLPRGVNVYRLLDDISILKYIDALGFVIYSRMVQGDAPIKELLVDPNLAKSLDVNIASIETSFGIAPVLRDKFMIMIGDNNE
jgi:hypothetical protein